VPKRIKQSEKNNWSVEAGAALANGDLTLAHQLSGQLYSVSGQVVHGNHLGRKLGFPTANLKLEEGFTFLLPYGVYAVKTKVGNLTFNGMANAGVRPTVDGTTMTLEVNLFDFSGDLYGESITVTFYECIRPERKFQSLDELVEQIRNDKTRTALIFS
jgi:riboflavin kinase/FMN adenylyltransferase